MNKKKHYGYRDIIGMIIVPILFSVYHQNDYEPIGYFVLQVQKFD